MKKLGFAVFFLIVVLAASALVYRRELLAYFGGGKLRHPGTILVVETPSGKQSEEDAAQKPLREQWVFLKNGHEVATSEEAEAIIPIVRVDIFKGPDGSILEVHEQGPNGQSLRRRYDGRR